MVASVWFKTTATCVHSLVVIFDFDTRKSFVSDPIQVFIKILFEFSKKANSMLSE